MIENLIPLKSYSELNKHLIKSSKLFLLLYKDDSIQSKCAYNNLKIISPNNQNLFAVNVSKVKDIHEEFNITTVPCLLEFSESKLANIYKGCQSEEYYGTIVNCSGFTAKSTDLKGKKTKRVIVYTTPTCSWCNTIKTYLKENNIIFNEVNVAANQAAEDEMVKKSGKKGVPQTDINGQIVVGFDKSRINQLLEIQ